MTPADPDRAFPGTAVVRELREPDELAALMTPGRLVVLTFTGSWCGSCTALEPVLADVAREWAGGAAGVEGGSDVPTPSPVFVTADTLRLPTLSAAYAVRTVPTTLLFGEGVVLDSIIGPVTRKELRERVRVAAEHAGRDAGR